MGKYLDRLIIHESTRAQLGGLVGSDTQGLLLTGESGVGLGTIAVAVADTIRTRKTMLQNIVPDDKGTIGVEIVQQLYHSLRTRHADAIVIVIDDADSMSLDAQNALLKLLEEPPEHVSFILTSHAPEILLPTITSRVQEVMVKKPSKTETDQLIPQDIDTKKRAQIAFLASGYPAEMNRLINNEEYFNDQVVLMGQARQFLSQSSFERMAYIHKSNHNRVTAITFLRMLGGLVLFSIDKQPNDTLIYAADAIESALETLRQNGNIRLQLTNLSLRLGRM